MNSAQSEGIVAEPSSDAGRSEVEPTDDAGVTAIPDADAGAARQAQRDVEARGEDSEDEEGTSSSCEGSDSADGAVPEGIPWWRKVRRKDLPPEFWAELRKDRNRRRAARNKANRRVRMAAMRQEAEEQLAELPPEERLARIRARAQQKLEEEEEAARRIQQALENGQPVVVDCAFNEGGSDREMRSLAKQLEVCSSFNRKSQHPFKLVFTSFQGRLEEFACGRMGGKGWKVVREARATLDLFPAERLVVLSPDAPQPLMELEEDKVYVIGGMIDRTIQKNSTSRFAEQQGLQTRRLPLEEFIQLEGEGALHAKWKILNVQDALLALLEFRAHGDWKVALEKALPPRKKRRIPPNPKTPSCRSDGPPVDASASLSDAVSECSGGPVRAAAVTEPKLTNM